MSGLYASMSTAELMIAGGGALILLSDLVFAVFGQYSFSNVIWLSGAVALLLVLTNGRMAGLGFSAGTYRTLLILLAAVAVLAGLRNLLGDLLYIPGVRLDVTYFLGMLGIYAGIVLIAVGAWQLWKRPSA